jgi:acetolactate synthase-1/2/3 large subunit
MAAGVFIAASLASVQRTGGELVLDSLKAAGVDTAFGIISVHNIPIFDALAREGGVRLIPARSEHGAAAMADGFARATGRLAAVITSTGVGAANAAGPMLEAYSASSPVIHVTGQVEAAYIEGDKGFLHGAKDQLTMLESVGKAAFRAVSTEEIPATMAKAMRLAVAGRPGPVSVEIPIDQQYRAIEASADGRLSPPQPRAPDADAVERAAHLIRNARRPLIWAGGGVISADAAAELTALAERIGAGVITTAAGRGALPEDNPQCVGFFPVDARVAELLDKSDLLVAVGTRFRGNETRNWQLDLPTPRIQIDVEPSLLGRNYPIDVGIAADARLALAALCTAVPSARDPEWLAAVAEIRHAARTRARDTLGPYARILDDLRATLARDAIVVRDVTIPATTWGARLLETYVPRTVLYSATYAIGMGFGLAIGAAIGRPDRDVVLLAGDGGFVTALGELATIAQEKARVRVVLFNDGGYGILRNLQDQHFDGRRFGVDLLTPDFPRLAETFGIWSGQVRSAVEMGLVLKEALAQDGPALIEVDMVAVGPMAAPFTGSARLVPDR